MRPRWARCRTGVAIFDRDVDDRLRQPGRGDAARPAGPRAGGTQHLGRAARARRHHPARLPAARPRRRPAGDLAGFYPPAGRWLSVTAGMLDGLLQMTFRDHRRLGRPARRRRHRARPGGDRQRRRPGPATVPRRGQRVPHRDAGHRRVGDPAGRAGRSPILRLGDRGPGRRRRLEGNEDAWAHRDPARRHGPGHLHARPAAWHG